MCSVKGCLEPDHCRGLCHRHYRRLQRHGDPLKGGRERGVGVKDLTEWVKTRSRDECWHWTGMLNAYGYGVYGQKGMKRGHHTALELDGRPNPGGLQANHTCDQRDCVNPDHLYWGTQGENIQDALDRGRAPQLRRMP